MTDYPDESELMAKRDRLILQANHLSHKLNLPAPKAVMVPAVNGGGMAEDVVGYVEDLEAFVASPTQYHAQRQAKPGSVAHYRTTPALAAEPPTAPQISATAENKISGPESTLQDQPVTAQAPALSNTLSAFAGPASASANPTAQPVKMTMTEKCVAVRAGKPVPTKPRKQTATDRCRAALAKKA